MKKRASLFVLERMTNNEYMEWVSVVDFFLNPVFSPSTLGSMFMGISSGLMGIFLYVKKRSLLGEALSHSTYPGVIVSVLIAGALSIDQRTWLFPFFLFFGSFFSGVLGLTLLSFLEEKLSYHSDVSLCFVLSTFLGVGILISSIIQFSYPALFYQIQSLLYGQLATILMLHVYLYVILVLSIIAFVGWYFFPLQIVHFDPVFARLQGISLCFFHRMLLLFLIFSIILGIRGVGVILMAGMFIAPPVCAKQFSTRFWQMFFLSPFFGMIFGFFGNFFSVNASIWCSQRYHKIFILPTGPVILIVSTMFVVVSLFFSRQGIVSRYARHMKFRMQCVHENILKKLFHHPAGLSVREIEEFLQLPVVLLFFLLKKLMSLQKIFRKKHRYFLTDSGKKEARRIIRLHRLWELYLFHHCSGKIDEIHANAEQMEHIITPEMENRLMNLFKNFTVDPHNREIPEE